MICKVSSRSSSLDDADLPLGPVATASVVAQLRAGMLVVAVDTNADAIAGMRAATNSFMMQNL